MRNLSFAFSFVLFFASHSFAQINITTGYTASELAENLVGEGIEVVSSSLTCFNQGFGLFDCVDCNLGIDSGLVLTTGKAMNATGPNDSEFTGFDTPTPGDPDLNAIMGVGPTQDACVLELDFIPNYDTVRFDYVFGSDEYIEWVGTSFNDVFAFYISGPGIMGDVNIALVPGTPLPVTIGNINPGSYSGYYIDNPSSGAALTDPYYIEYDGFTTMLQAFHSVTPCETYHLKLAIGDVGDGSYDSGVFLKANSLTTNYIATFDYPSAGGGSAAEYCTSGIDPAPSLDTSATSGVWSATPAGLVIDPASGIIDLSASTPGTYTVTNMVIFGFCEFDTVTASFPVIITEPSIALFSYTGSPFCITAADPSPILGAGAEAGTFTAAPSGCAINSTTGVIDVSASSAGTYIITNTIAASGGCPAVTATTTIIIINTYDISIGEEICTGESYILPDGSVVDVSGIYINSFTSSGGCDSIITTTLTVNPVYDFDENVNICEGDSYILPDGSSVSSAGTFISNLLSSAGCDSIITTNLSIVPLSYASVNAEICSGEFYFFADGSSTASAGTFETIIPAASGCDSIITTTLAVHPVYSIPQSVDICTGSTYTLPDGTTAYGAGIYYSNFFTIEGCDSVIVTTVNELDVINIIIDAAICEGFTYTLPDGSIVSATGSYVENYFTVSGCDSVITTNLTVNPNPDIEFTPDDIICIEKGNYILGATPEGGIYTGDHVEGDVFSATGAGVGGPYAITYYFTDANGCSDTAIAFISVDANYAEAFGDTTIIAGNATPVYGFTGGDYLWTPPIFIDCASCASAFVTPPQTTTYTLTSKDENGCYASDAITITVNPDPGEYVFVPNSFSPNGDNVNDYFFVYGPNLLIIKEMRIYDRWGELLFERTDIPANDINLGWNGTQHGLQLNTGVFAYTLLLQFTDGDQEFTKGNVTIVK